MLCVSTFRNDVLPHNFNQIWIRKVSPKSLYLFIKVHGIKNQNFAILLFTFVKPLILSKLISVMYNRILNF